MWKATGATAEMSAPEKATLEKVVRRISDAARRCDISFETNRFIKYLAIGELIGPTFHQWFPPTKKRQCTFIDKSILPMDRQYKSAKTKCQNV